MHVVLHILEAPLALVAYLEAQVSLSCILKTYKKNGDHTAILVPALVSVRGLAAHEPHAALVWQLNPLLCDSRLTEH